MGIRMQVNGITDIQTTFEEFREFGNKSAAVAVVRAGMRVFAEQMKNDLKPQVAHMAEEIGYRFERNTEDNTVSGKVGVGVGKRIQWGSANRKSRGVGITGDTWHWWVLGSFRSGQRFTKQKGKKQNRGVLKPQQANFANESKRRAEQRAKAAMEAALARSVETFSRNQ